MCEPGSASQPGAADPFWRRWTQDLEFGAVFILIASTVLLVIYHDNGSSGFFRAHLAGFFGPSKFGSLYPAFYWYASSLILLGLIPLFLGTRVVGRPAADWGVTLGDWRFGLKASLGLFLLFLPVLVAVSFLPEFQSKYPLYSDASRSLAHLLLYEAAYAVYFIGWEFIFRGFMLFGLRPALGHYAVFVQMIPFALMHFGKPEMETLGAVVAGVVLGYLALRARSFWYGWLLHALVALANDLLALAHKQWWP